MTSPEINYTRGSMILQQPHDGKKRQALVVEAKIVLLLIFDAR
jgi:hypothetical protein